MTFLPFATSVIYLLLVAALFVASVIDIRRRIIPNAIPVVIVGLWVVWGLVGGIVGYYTGFGFFTTILAPAPAIQIAPEIDIVGVSFTEGLLGAFLMGVAMFVVSTAYEAITHRVSFGGGDIKLMMAISLFLGFERAVICLLVASLGSLVYAVVWYVRGRIQMSRGCLMASSYLEIAEVRGVQAPALIVSDTSYMLSKEEAKEVALHKEFLAKTVPFAPFIMLGTLISAVM